MLKKIITTVIFVALASAIHAEDRVENVVLYNEDDGLVSVCYDLIADEPKRITLVGKANDFELEIDSVSGDVGIMIVPGTDKCVYWESLEDYPDGFKGYSVSLNLLVTDYDPIGEIEKKEELPPSDDESLARGGVKRRKALSEDEMLEIIADYSSDAKKGKRECDKAMERLERALDTGSKTRVDRLRVQRDYECREFNSLKRKLLDAVQNFEDRTDSNKAKKYLRVLE